MQIYLGGNHELKLKQIFKGKNAIFYNPNKEIKQTEQYKLYKDFSDQGGEVIIIDTSGKKHSKISLNVEPKKKYESTLNKIDYVLTSQQQADNQDQNEMRQSLCDELNISLQFLTKLIDQKLKILPVEWLKACIQANNFIEDFQKYIHLNKIQQISKGEESKSQEATKSNKKRDLKDLDKKQVKGKQGKDDQEEEKKGSNSNDKDQGGEGKQKPLNNEIADQLDRLLKYYTTQGDRGRMFGYKRALTSLKLFNEPIYNIDQIDKVPNIGDGIRKKIKEFIDDGIIKRFEFIDTDEKHNTLKLIESVWGIGPKNAQKLYDKKIRTIEDLRKNQHLLTDMQKIGLKYHEDFIEKIPRKEVEQLLERVKQTAFKIFQDGEKHLQIQACGSFRRGRDFCGDIDVLITRTDGKSIEGINEKVVVQLEKEGFLKERLGALRKSATGSEGYQGICQLDKDHKFRRIDLKVYPADQYGYAILYFTGSGNFNVNMRTEALKLGYSLSDHGMHKLKDSKKKNIPCLKEEDIFTLLNMPFKAPNERDV
ncbi:helix-hairpin-helix motif family protein [Stylonychia lemnae]|uniref:DNA polymerase n=1 Tax=Stylonychia lemnae TaxID=5949 RepID=A0A077ZZ96_STYLE|nr:helix-hairpin-helix motif family protein [Stylonychia lemnae]|eukprot:CDW74543.1 helix-hairpin-helix motif family protein [Stylonychia lemnae]